MIYKAYKCDTYNIYTIKTDRFKTCHMEIVFRNNIEKETITLRSVLTEMLVESTKKYNTRKQMMIALEELYNSSFYAINTRIGKGLITSFCFDFINPDLVNEKIDGFIKMPLEAITRPNINNNEFDNKTLTYIKERVKKDIESIIEDPKNYSINKLLETMCDKTESSINMNGYIKDLETINTSNLYDYYKKMLEHDYIDIYIIGSLDMNKIVKIIKDNFKINILKNHTLNYIVNNKTIKKPKIINSNYNISQENICIGLNVNNITEFERDYVSQIYNMILGGGSLETKLYNRLRNENSLCYNCSSIYQKYDGLIIIHTAVSNENERKTIKLIKTALKDMTNNIRINELEDAKKLLITTLNTALDNPGRIIDNYLFKNILGLPNIEERIKKYNSISIDDIKEFSKKIKINTILCLKDGADGKD